VSTPLDSSVNPIHKVMRKTDCRRSENVYNIRRFFLGGLVQMLCSCALFGRYVLVSFALFPHNFRNDPRSCNMTNGNVEKYSIKRRTQETHKENHCTTYRIYKTYHLLHVYPFPPQRHRDILVRLPLACCDLHIFASVSSMHI